MAAKIACFVVLCIVAAARTAEALTCTEVDAYLKECVPFLTNTGLLGTCCDGVKDLNAVASTTVDRQIACTCLQAAAKNMLLLDLTKAADLPNTCEIELPFKISLDMACSTVV
uniref:Non-specific lipid-transfer protein n=1 Tax=Nicotiana tabacum TaxID=4097 RepID=A0A1S3ZXP2_TOBAC|nr:PREDICTED: non-specific lipid-transfer protein 2-like [Nicotiana tabacum]